MADWDYIGQTVGVEQLAHALGNAALDESGRRVIDAARFQRTVFTGYAEFRGVNFVGHASFASARFEAGAGFDECVFDGASFNRATFGGKTTFVGAVFERSVEFRDAEFGGIAELTRLKLIDGANFYRALFEDTVRLSCELTGALRFGEARFRGLTDLEVWETNDAEIYLDDALCEGQVDARLQASTVSIVRTRLERGGRIVVPRGELTVEGRLARPTLIAAAPDEREPPRLVRLSGSDVSGTTLSGIDLSDTRFAGVHGLEGLRIDGPLMLRPVDGRFGLRTRRKRIADEDDARAGVPTGGLPVSFAEVAAVYRDLRAGQEGRKDEPGSADFYYGEMEMRRLAAPKLSSERAILEAYRVTSGFGMRAWRSLATLGALVVAATIAFQAFLIEDPPCWLATLLFSLRSTVSFVREPRLPGMTLAAEYVQLGLRFAGPVLLALTVLAIRARVRR